MTITSLTALNYYDQQIAVDNISDFSKHYFNIHASNKHPHTHTHTHTHTYTHTHTHAHTYTHIHTDFLHSHTVAS